MILLLLLSKRLFKRPKVGEKEERWGRNVGTRHLTSVFCMESTCGLQIAHFPGRHRRWIKQTSHTVGWWPYRACVASGCGMSNASVYLSCTQLFVTPAVAFSVLYLYLKKKKSPVMCILTASQSAGNMHAKCHFTNPLQYSTNSRVLLESLLINSLWEHMTTGFGVSHKDFGMQQREYSPGFKKQNKTKKNCDAQTKVVRRSGAMIWG